MLGEILQPHLVHFSFNCEVLNCTPLGGSGVGGVDEQGNNEGAGEGAVPSERVRKMEIRANEAFDVYINLFSTYSKYFNLYI